MTYTLGQARAFVAADVRAERADRGMDLLITAHAFRSEPRMLDTLLREWLR